ncbi:COG1525 Micrococcal nuclease (thermonuclease) homologs [Burkholderiaceae bacterium]
MNLFKRLVWGVVVSACAGTPTLWAQNFAARVVTVSDGDTVWVTPLQSQRRQKLRLQGIDAPERCQPGGEASTRALRELLLNQTVEVEVSGHDDYQRGLARIRYQGKDVGAFMVSQGHAWSYRFKSDPGPYVREETAARQARLGVFAQARPERPYDFRRRHGPCG